jgi:predicted aspartyl protease
MIASERHRGARAGACVACTLLLLVAIVPGRAAFGAPDPVPPGGGDEAAPALPPAEVDQVVELDHAGRVLANVFLNGRGPLRFILDTGANRSAVSARMLGALDPTLTPDSEINVHGVTGPAVLPALTIDRLQVGDLSFHGVRVPVLGDDVFADADGILGIDLLQNARIEVDVENDRVVVRRSRGKRATEGYLTVPARLLRGGLLLVNGKVGRLPVKVILDTGAERSLGNPRLLEALLADPAVGGAQVAATVLGATPGVIEGTALVAPTIRIGDAVLSDLSVTFGDLHVFHVWGLDDEPALLIGMDLLGRLRAFVVDYPRREFQLLPTTEPKPRSIQLYCGRACRLALPDGR